MRLSSLRLKGFKSFANDTVINFSEDVIGIIGPNGSGKSNIVDAIRWVLGEQKSKDLRLDKMSSVIFNGTKKRKAAGMAMVSLTLDNTKNILPTEYQTVTISRILYASGESEYRLNDVKCRRKDIQSLFLDSGIGSNSYAIISLSMVDDLLLDNNNARRLMFEQAAGISKYKTRKHQTLLKLKNTEEDLSRIEDLLFEIEANMKSLERQAKRTQRYYDIKEQYKQRSIQLSVIQLARSKDIFQELDQKIKQESDRLIAIEAEEKKLEAQLEQLRKQQIDLENNLSDIQREANEFLAGIRQMENDKQMAEQRLQFIRDNHQRSQNQIAITQNRIADIQKTIDAKAKELRQQQNIEAKLKAELEDIRDQLELARNKHAEQQAGMEHFFAKQQDLERTIHEIEKKRAVNANQLEQAKQEIQQSRTDIQAKSGEGKQLQKQLKEITSKIEKLQKQNQKLIEQQTHRNDSIQQLRQQEEKIRSVLFDRQREFDAVQNEYDLTKSMVESLEGFPESVKFLKKSKAKAAQFPLLTDIILCPDDYRIAIENYLKPFLNHYIVPDYDTAQAGIELLQKSQKGKAAFFILDEVKPVKASMQKIDKAVAAASLIQVDEKYRHLIEQLLFNTYVVDDHRDAVRLRKYFPEFNFIERSGTFISKGNSVSGGSIGLFEGKKIGRRKRLEVLDKKLRKLQKEINELNKQLGSVRQQLAKLTADDLAPTIETNNAQLNEWNRIQIEIATRLENIESFVSNYGQKAAKAKDFIIHLEKNAADLDKQLQKAKAEYQQFKQQLQSADDQFRAASNELAAASERFNQKNIAFIQQQNRVAHIRREIEFHQHQLQELNDHLHSTTQSLSQADAEVNSILATISQLQQKLAENYNERKEKEAILNDAEQAWHLARNQVNELEEKLRDTYRMRQETLSLVADLKEKFNELKLELTSVTERVEIEFGVSRDELMQMDIPQDIDIEKTQDEVQKLRDRLNRFGEINPMAIEAYNEIKERYDTIDSQRQDILDAKESLLQTIKEIDETATKQFMDAFEKVRNHFKTVFRSLFSEQDDCDLLLETPDQPLDSRIKIVAKPKGKRPQSISLLSGGEKTLTATALLFALYLLKPAPFCIFDEVDAPLDDANIEKFNKIIKKFSKDSQFIIITHNKQTMAAVDVIYGVYMQEPGVSSVTPVDFRNYKHEANLIEAKS